MKFEKYLKEEYEKIDNRDIREIEKYLQNPKRGSFVLKSYSKNYNEDEREVDVLFYGKDIIFEYNLGFDELTNFFMEYFEKLGIKYKHIFERHINTTSFYVNKNELYHFSKFK